MTTAALKPGESASGCVPREFIQRGSIPASGAVAWRQPRDGRLIVLVTHYVTIAGLAGETVSSGKGVLLKLQDNGEFRVVRHLDFGF